MKKYKEFIKNIYVPHKSIDYFIYVALILFLIITIILDTNYIITTLIAILFMIIILLFYIFQTKMSKVLKQEKYINKIDLLSKEELKKIIIKYYKDRKYKIIAKENYFYIEKNNNKYKILLFLNNLSISSLNKIQKTKKEIKGIIIVTNQEINKEERKYIKENNLFSITRNGLIEIIKEQEKEEQVNDKRRKKRKV